MAIDWTKINNIAVVCRSALGDLVCADCLMQYLKDHASHAKITLFVDTKNSCLVPYLQHYDKFVIINGPGNATEPRRRGGNKYFHLLKTALMQRHYKFDLAIISKGTPSRMLNIFMWALGAKIKVAYVKNDWHGRLIRGGTLFDANLEGTCHHAVEVLKLLDPAYSIVEEKYYPKLHIPEYIEKSYASILCDKLQPITKFQLPLLLVSVTNNRSHSTLSIAKYVHVLNTAFSYEPFSLVISCLPKDQQIAEELRAKALMPTLVMPTEDFNLFMMLLQMIDMVFVGDGGIMHMAAALDKQVLALFGRTSVTSWKPLSRKATYLFDAEDVDNIPDAYVINVLISHLKSLARFML